MMRRKFRLSRFLSFALMVSCGQAPGAETKQAASTPAGPLPTPAPIAYGKRLFIEKCAMCHGPGGMGTGLLARRVEEPLLEKRTDLDADYVVQAARVGIGNMPAIPRGEVSDEQLKRIADYLARKKAPE